MRMTAALDFARTGLQSQALHIGLVQTFGIVVSPRW